MQSYVILAHAQQDRKMEAELQDLRREQDRDLRELETARQEMESGGESSHHERLNSQWNECRQHGR